MTSFWRNNDVIIAYCVYWAGSKQCSRISKTRPICIFYHFYQGFSYSELWNNILACFINFDQFRTKYDPHPIYIDIIVMSHIKC